MTSDLPTRRQAIARERLAAATAPAPVAAHENGDLPSRRELRARAEREAGRRPMDRRSTEPTASPRLAPAGAREATGTAVTAPTRTASTPRTAPSARRSPATRLGVAAAMLFVGATVVATSVPANAYFVDTPTAAAQKFAAATATAPAAVDRVQGWQSSATSGAVVAGRDGYTVTSDVTAASSGATAVYGAASAAVQWPFPPPVPISSGFGSRRVANCSFCSTNHQGLDFVPGAGTPIHVVADGVVSKVDQGSGALGYNVWVDHVIDGVTVTTVSAHMKAGSIAVQPGQKVTRGQVLGLVGSTGNSTGAHLHFEVHVGGTPIDPLPWLTAHAGAA